MKKIKKLGMKFAVILSLVVSVSSTTMISTVKADDLPDEINQVHSFQELEKEEVKGSAQFNEEELIKDETSYTEDNLDQEKTEDPKVEDVDVQDEEMNLDLTSEEFEELRDYAMAQLQEKFDNKEIGENEFIRKKVIIEGATSVERLVKEGIDFSELPELLPAPKPENTVEVTPEEFEKLRDYAMAQLQEKFDNKEIGENEFIRYKVLIEMATTVERLVELGTDFGAIPELPLIPEVEAVVPEFELNEEQLSALRLKALEELAQWILNGELTLSEIDDLYLGIKNAGSLQDFIDLGFFIRPSLPEIDSEDVEEVPEVETPEVETPEVETPEVETPEVETPGEDKTQDEKTPEKVEDKPATPDTAASATYFGFVATILLALASIFVVKKREI